MLGKKNVLHQTIQKTKGLEVALVILIVMTGSYLLFAIESAPPYLKVKIILVFVAIALGALSFKHENKIINIVTLLLFIYIYSIAITKYLNFKDKQLIMSEFNLEGLEGSAAENIIDANNNAALQQGKVIYKVLCVECHGEDGKTPLPEVANLAASKLSMDEKVEIITNGKGIMHGYDAELSEQEITLVAAYTETLK